MPELYLWDLQRGDTFEFVDQPGVEMLFLGADGMYFKVRALDPDINKAMCARYDAHSDFFAIITVGEVVKIVPKCFEVEHVVDFAGERQSTVIIPKPKPEGD
jgi:hypothetical protein